MPNSSSENDDEMLKHLASSDEFDSYFQPPKSLIGSNGADLVPAGIDVPLWNCGSRRAFEDGRLHVFSIPMPDGFQAQIDAQVPKTEIDKTPYIAVSVISFYSVSLLCQMIDNHIPPGREPLGPITFEIFIPKLNSEDLSYGSIPMILEKSACRDENRPEISLDILQSTPLRTMFSDTETVGVLATVEYNGRSLMEEKRMAKWLRRIGGEEPLDVRVTRRPDFVESMRMGGPETLIQMLSGTLPTRQPKLTQT